MNENCVEIQKNIRMCIIVAVLALLLFAGAASAFTVTQEAVSDPSGSLVSGEDVTSHMGIRIYDGEMSASGSLTLDTDLVGPSWTVDVYTGGTRITTLNPSYVTGYAISGFDLVGYGTDIDLAIAVEGTVSSDSVGSSISTIMLSESGGSGLSTYTSAPQNVYDTGKFQTLIDGISSVETAINEYVADGYDSSQAQGFLETARAIYQAAVASGTENGSVASTTYEEGTSALEKAKQSLAYISLGIIQSATSKIDDIVTRLYSNGMDTEAKHVDTKNTKIKSSYDACMEDYLAGNADLSELKSLYAEVFVLYNEAKGYLSSSASSPAGTPSSMHTTRPTSHATVPATTKPTVSPTVSATPTPMTSSTVTATTNPTVQSTVLPTIGTSGSQSIIDPVTFIIIISALVVIIAGTVIIVRLTKRSKKTEKIPITTIEPKEIHVHVNGNVYSDVGVVASDNAIVNRATVTTEPAKKCPYCGAELKSDDKFCSKCGKEI